jgi:hypothetical protein
MSDLFPLPGKTLLFFAAGMISTMTGAIHSKRKPRINHMMMFLPLAEAITAAITADINLVMNSINPNPFSDAMSRICIQTIYQNFRRGMHKIAAYLSGNTDLKGGEPLYFFNRVIFRLV